MAALPVFVEFWQLECCGDPFAVGGEIAWNLVLIDAQASETPWPDHLLVDITAVVGDPATSDDGQVGFRVVVDGVTAWWPGAPPDRERFTVRGLLLEDHHGSVPADMPTARGRVERIRLVKAPYRRVRANHWAPTAGEWKLEDLPHSPSQFQFGHPRGDVAFEETGLLVDVLPL